MKPSEWIEDNETNRAYDGKTLHIFNNEEDQGVFKMRVSETDQQGNRRPGFIQIQISPYDLVAALHPDPLKRNP